MNMMHFSSEKDIVMNLFTKPQAFNDQFVSNICQRFMESKAIDMKDHRSFELKFGQCNYGTPTNNDLKLIDALRKKVYKSNSLFDKLWEKKKSIDALIKPK